MHARMYACMYTYDIHLYIHTTPQGSTILDSHKDLCSDVTGTGRVTKDIV